jgi:Short C-terminal domain
MATSSIVVQLGAARAVSAIVAAVTEAGGKISSQLPGQPIRFMIKGRDGDNWSKRNSQYAGVAHLTPGSSGQTRVDVAVKARDIDVVARVVITVTAVLFLGFMPTPFPFFNLMMIVACLWAAAHGAYLASTSQTEYLDRIVAALSPATCTAWGSFEGHPSMGSEAVEQLKNLGELRAAGVLTDAEFNATKAELLKRMGAHALA